MSHSRSHDHDYLIWSESGTLWAGTLRGDAFQHALPITIDDREYHHYAGWKNDNAYFWGAHIDRNNRLIGFDVHIIEDPAIIGSPFAMRTEGVHLDQGNLVAMFMEDPTSRYKALEGFPVDFYCSSNDDFLIRMNGSFWDGSVAFEPRRLG